MASGAVIDPEVAKQIAEAWIAAWNSHDLGRVMTFYRDDFEMRSPGIVAVANEPSGILKGKDKVRAYWAKGLTEHPGLRFELRAAHGGIQSVAISYRHVGRFEATEVLEFDAGGLVIRASAHRGPALG